jgi:hypothetical protein
LRLLRLGGMQQDVIGAGFPLVLGLFGTLFPCLANYPEKYRLDSVVSQVAAKSIPQMTLFSAAFQLRWNGAFTPIL